MTPEEKQQVLNGLTCMTYDLTIVGPQIDRAMNAVLNDDPKEYLGAIVMLEIVLKRLLKTKSTLEDMKIIGNIDHTY